MINTTSMATADVSVIIPTYNRVSFLVKAIDSVLAQTLRPREIIVIDDGSTDDTAKLVSNYRETVIFLFQKNQGVSAARNTGIARATSKYIAFLDSDDFWAPEKIERQVNTLEGNRQCIAHVCNIAWYQSERYLEHPFWIRSKKKCFVKEGVMHQPLAWVLQDSAAVIQSIMIRSEVLNKSGVFDPILSLWEDTDFAARVALCGPWAYSNIPMAFIREISEGEGRLSRVRTSELLKSYLIRRDILLSLRKNSYALKKEVKLLINDELSTACYALAGLRFRNSEISEAINLYRESFNQRKKFKTLMMLFFSYAIYYKGHWLYRRFAMKRSDK